MFRRMKWEINKKRLKVSERERKTPKKVLTKWPIIWASGERTLPSHSLVSLHLFSDRGQSARVVKHSPPWRWKSKYTRDVNRNTLWSESAWFRNTVFKNSLSDKTEYRSYTTVFNSSREVWIIFRNETMISYERPSQNRQERYRQHERQSRIRDKSNYAEDESD